MGEPTERGQNQHQKHHEHGAGRSEGDGEGEGDSWVSVPQPVGGADPDPARDSAAFRSVLETQQLRPGCT